MKVFALLCAAAIAVSTLVVDAADVAVACTGLECTKDSGATLEKGEKIVYTPQTCSDTTQKAYPSVISITGTAGDKLTYTTKNGATELTGTDCATTTGAATVSAGSTTPLLCGYGTGVATTVEVTCGSATTNANCVIAGNTVTFVCAATTQDVAVTCTDQACTGAANLEIPYGRKAVFTPPACTPDTQKSFLKVIDIVGAGTDKLTYTSKNGETALTGTECAVTTPDDALAAGKTTALTCGSGTGVATTVEVACTTATPAKKCTLATSAVTFECAAGEVGDVTPVCATNACTTAADYKIPFGKKATFTPPSCATGQFPYLKSIAITGATSDKLTYVTNIGTTPSTTAGCLTATGGAGSNAISSETECGKGEGAVTSVDVKCGNTATDCVLASGAVTFDCATTTQKPSMGNMVTKANAIVGVVSGMLGAVVYFNRG